MYPRNAASPERLAIGAVVQISDGAVQTTGITITVRGQGGAEGTGAGTTAIGASGIVYYTPTQAETNFTSFVVIASKTACLPVAQTIITTASVTPGQVRLEGVTHTGAVVPAVTTVNGLAANVITAGSINAAALNGKGDWNIGKTGYSLTANTGLGNQTANITGNLSGSVGSVTGLTASNLDATVSSRLATAGYTAPDNAGISANGSAIAAVQADTDDIQTRLPAALVSGRMDSFVGAMGTNTLSADAVSAGAVDKITEGIDIVATAASLNKRAESQNITTGSPTNDYTATFAVDGVKHQIADVAGEIDLYYEFDIGRNAAPTGYTMVGIMTGKDDGPIGAFAWNWDAVAWEQLGSVLGRDGSTNETVSFPLLVAHVGTAGADLGKVRIRWFANTNLSTSVLNIDQQLVSYAVIPQSVGFSGQVQAATSTTVDLPTSASSVVDFYKPGLLTVVSGTGKDQYARITDYSGAPNRRLTLAKPMAVTLDTTSFIQISPWGSVRVSEYDAGVIDADSVNATAANKIADHTLRRTYANARASSNGDTYTFRSLLGGLAKLVNKWSISGSTLTLTHEDDSTTAGTQTLTGTAGADPITTIDTD